MKLNILVKLLRYPWDVTIVGLSTDMLFEFDLDTMFNDHVTTNQGISNSNSKQFSLVLQQKTFIYKTTHWMLAMPPKSESVKTETEPPPIFGVPQFIP